jgi:cytoskeletal protein RodZ
MGIATDGSATRALIPMATPASDSSNTNFHDTSATTKADESIALGELLRQNRERRGMSLEQIASETKIPLRHLQALERDDLSVVPEGLYRRAKIRAYARAVHLDRETLAKLEHAMHAAEPPPVALEEPGLPTTVFRKSVLVTLTVIGVALVLGLAVRRQHFVAATPEPNDAIDLKPPQQTTAAEPLEPTTPDNEATADSSVAATSGSRLEPAQVSTEADIKPRVAQGLNTELLVTSEPAGARVTVDGIGRGFTPVTIRHLEPGTRQIRVTKDGYQSEERAAHVAGGSLNALHVSMQALP